MTKEKLFEIIHEDDELLVINKPAGLVCHPTKTDEYSSLIGRIRLYLNSSLSTSGGEGRGEGVISTLNDLHSTNLIRPHLVHRLDRETSGLVIAAKNSTAARELGNILENRAAEKEYLAIVHGHVRDDRGLIDAPLGKDEQSRVAIKDCVRPDGAAAQTEFQVEKRFERIKNSAERLSSDLHPLASAFTLLRLQPKTGRKHQLRIHLAHLGHPIVGDKLYGGDEDLYLALVENRLTEEQKQRLLLPHHALHAHSLRFPWRGRLMEFQCEPDSVFAAFLG